MKLLKEYRNFYFRSLTGINCRNLSLPTRILMRLKRPKSALIENSVMTGLYFLKKMPVKPATMQAGADLALSVISITES
ncbi:hypothetical protein H8J70_04250 [Megasphaera hominis]|uniref:Uncharacterized protein n=1 Tax=Megasphaera hominis TaxID=159836 RepID=A0ABR6VGU1_9FIRM|nr:hypothetical protein [Megasphaera hominis]